MNNFALQTPEYLAYLRVIAYLAPAICSIFVTILIFLSMRSNFDSRMRAFSIMASMYSLTIAGMWLLLLAYPQPTPFHVAVECVLIALAYALPGGVLLWYYLDNKATRPDYKHNRRTITAIIIEAVMLVAGCLLAATDSIPWIWLVFSGVTISGSQILLAYYIIRRGPSRTKYELSWDDAKKMVRSNGAINDNLVNWLPPLPGERSSTVKLTRRAVEDYFHSYRPYVDPEFKLSQLATAMNVNRSEMSAFINGEFGMNFRRYVNRWRLSEYQRLMTLPSNERKSTTKIVAMAGFRDNRHYQRALESENQEAKADDTASESKPKSLTSE